MKNKIILNIPELHGEERPEPDLPVVTLNNVAVENVIGIHIVAAHGSPTTVSLTFYSAVGGFVGQTDMADTIKKASQ